MYNRRMTSDAITIRSAMDRYLDGIRLARSQNTHRTYSNGLTVFRDVLVDHHIDPDTALINQLNEDAIVWLATALKDRAATTERLYLTAATSFYEYLAAENLTPINLPRVRLLIRQRARRPGVRLPQFPRDAIEQIVDYMLKLPPGPYEDEKVHLRDLRDRAFLITLADTGLRGSFSI